MGKCFGGGGELRRSIQHRYIKGQHVAKRGFEQKSEKKHDDDADCQGPKRIRRKEKFLNYVPSHKDIFNVPLKK